MDNPYQISAYGSSYPTATGQVSPGIIQALASTKPWVRLCSIMGFIGAGFMVFCGIVMIAGGAISGMRNTTPRPMGWIPTFMGVIYLATSLMCLLPSLKLWKYGTAILRLMSSQSAADLQQAVDEQRGFWKFAGILVVIFAAMMMLGFIGAVIAAVTAGAASR